MISVNHIKPVLLMKQGEEPEHIVMNFNDLAHSPVFPQLIPVSQLNIGKTLLIVMVQSRKIKVLVFEKVVVGIAPAAVAVADDSVAAAAG